jgi:hypothetical protein
VLKIEEVGYWMAVIIFAPKVNVPSKVKKEDNLKGNSEGTNLMMDC